MSIIKPYTFLSKSEIEFKANEVIKKIESSRDSSLTWPLDTMDVAEYLGLDFDFESIPSDSEGVVAAMIFPTKKLIIINQDLESMSDPGQNGFRESTIGHEIGHWILHINIDEVEGNAKQQELNFSGITQIEESFLCRSLDENGDWREWQAQYFSSCLLMPRYVLEKIRSKYNLNSLKDLYGMKDEMGVTISNLIHRLKDLDWIDNTLFQKSDKSPIKQSHLF